MFQKHKWEWFVTLNVDDHNPLRIEQKLKSWRKYIRHEGFEIGYIGLFNYERNPHIHLLMILKDQEPSPNKNLETEIEKFEKYWNVISTRTCKIDKIYGIKGVCEYLSEQNTPSGKFDLVTPIGVCGFLKKFEITVQ